MCKTFTHRLDVRHVATIFLLAVFAVMQPAQTSHAGTPPDAAANRHPTLMVLSIRIAQAQGNEGKVRRYKSLARQQRARKKLPAAAHSSPNARFAPW